MTQKQESTKLNSGIILYTLLMITACYRNTALSKQITSIEIKKRIIDNHISADTLTIPQFFQRLTTTYSDDYYMIDSTAYQAFCLSHQVDSESTDNKLRYYSIRILHELFTSRSATNCSRGSILNIPYLWHWVEPNPRYEIYFTANSQKLKDTRPPKELSKYRSYADIDRTPYAFLSDLASPELKYYSAQCDTFSTFGWCSEREMAFVALTSLLGYQSKVITESNHSWSEMLVPLNMTDGEVHLFTVIVDNTFHNLQWQPIAQAASTEWKKYVGHTSRSSWYNRSAKSETELSKISRHRMSLQSMQRIEEALINFLKTHEAED